MTIQHKLKVSQPDDPLKREADQLSEMVINKGDIFEVDSINPINKLL